jgi:hypothetical protein
MEELMSVKSKFAIALLLLLVIGLPMLVKGPDGRPMMTVNDWLPDGSSLAATEGKAVAAMSSLKALVDVGSPAVSASSQQQRDSHSGMLAADVTGTDGASRAVTTGKMYKWQDDKGRWHFSSQPPPDGRPVSVENLPNVENVMEAPVRERENNSTIRLPAGFGFGGDG